MIQLLNLGLFFFFLSIVLLIISNLIKRNIKKIKNEKKIQQGKISYNDLYKPAKPLFSKILKLSGKPDYVIKQDKYYIPIELKTGKHNKPQKNHIFQLAAYCQLLEENYGGFVPYGILVYNNKYQYKIPYDPKTRFELDKTIQKMRYALKNRKIIVNHNDIRRCKSCSMRTYCDINIL